MSNKLEQIVYFLVDRTNKAMRRYTQKVFREQDFEITIDQFVLLKLLHEEQGLTQMEMGLKLYKDNASITRMVDQLVKHEYILRSISDVDRRTFKLELTKKGVALVNKVFPVIQEIRKEGVEDVSKQDLDITINTLNKIIENFS